MYKGIKNQVTLKIKARIQRVEIKSSGTQPYELEQNTNFNFCIFVNSAIILPGMPFFQIIQRFEMNIGPFP